jgi:signal transduction histidine kinase
MMKREVDALRVNIGMNKERRYTFSRCDIGVILEENVERFKSVLLEKDIEIDYQKSGNLEAYISANDIDRVICNLLYNARKYSYEGKGRFVKIRAREVQPANMIEISICSLGIPIKKEEIETGKIWDFGYRGDMAYATDRDGTGIGLADAKEVIENHNGEICITSIPTRNETNPPGYKVPYLTTVLIKIPRAR